MESEVATNGSSNRSVLLPLPLVGGRLFLFKRKRNVIVLVSLLPSPLQGGWEESFFPGQQIGLTQTFFHPPSPEAVPYLGNIWCCLETFGLLRIGCSPGCC